MTCPSNARYQARRPMIASSAVGRKPMLGGCSGDSRALAIGDVWKQADPERQKLKRPE
jgi:hypothetical protein